LKFLDKKISDENDDSFASCTEEIELPILPLTDSPLNNQNIGISRIGVSAGPQSRLITNNESDCGNLMAMHTAEMETKREKMKQFKIVIYVESYEDYTHNNSMASNPSMNNSLREFEQFELNAAASVTTDSNLYNFASPSNNLTRNVIEGVNIQPVKQTSPSAYTAPSSGRSQLKSSDDEFIFQATPINYENVYPVQRDDLLSKPPLSGGSPQNSAFSNRYLFYLNIYTQKITLINFNLL
jgi:hypothetical protein